MKKGIVKHIRNMVILVCFISMITSCNRIDVDKNETENIEINTSISERNFLFFEFVEDNPGIKKTDVEYWKQFMKNELNINAEYSLYQFGSENPIWLHPNIYEEIQNAWYFKSYKDKNLYSNMWGGNFVDISELFDSNKYSNHIIDYITVNDSIYFLPTYIGEKYMCRTYNNKVLDDLNFQVPTSTSEFYKFAKAIKNEYINESGNEVYIASYNIDTVLYDLYDIFLSFGCYMNFDAINPMIAINPKTNEIEYISDSENFILAMEYIQMFTDEGLLYVNTRGEIPDNIELVSLVEENNNTTFADEKYGLYLKGISEQYLVYGNYDLSGFGFPGDKGGVENFISIIENEVKNNELAKKYLTYGVEGKNYSINNKTLTINSDLINTLPSFRFNISNIDLVKTNLEINDEENLSKSEIIKESVNSLESNLVYYVDHNFKYKYFGGSERLKYYNIYFEFNYMCSAVFRGSASAQNGYLKYLKDIEEWYEEDMLDYFIKSD